MAAPSPQAIQRLRDDLAAVFAHGTPGQRKAIIETHIAAIKIDGSRLIPIFKIPTGTDTGPAKTSTDPGVRTMHQVVDLLESYSNIPGLRQQLDHLALLRGLGDDSGSTGFDGKVTKLIRDVQPCPG